MIDEAIKLLSEVPGERIVISDDWRRELADYPVERTVVFAGTHCAPLLKECGFEVWTGVEAEPCVETVVRMREYLQEKQPVYVIAAGGGSVLDAAKAAYLSFQSGMGLSELFGMNKFSTKFPEKHLCRLVTLPGTSGTGSEATPYSNIVDKELSVKKLIVEKESVPDVAVLAPELSCSMPEALTRATGCDALAHLLEGFLNVGADNNHPRANFWALTGIKLVKKYLLRACRDPEDMEARRAMSVAAALGGMTIRFKSTGLPHLCSFSWFGRIAHGDAVAMLLPEAWRYYLGNPAVEKRTMELADIFPGRNGAEVINSYREFITTLGMAEKLSAWEGITPELLEKTAACGSENKMKLELAPLPVPLERSYEILLSILQKSY